MSLSFWVSVSSHLPLHLGVWLLVNGGDCQCGINCLASALFLLFEAAHCLQYSHTKYHIGLGYGIEEPCHFLFNSFLRCQFLLKCPPLTLLESPRIHLSLVRSSCSRPRVISELTSALRQPEDFQEHPVFSVWSSLDWSIDVSFLLLVHDPLRLSMPLWLSDFIYYRLILTHLQLNSSPFLCNALQFTLLF